MLGCHREDQRSTLTVGLTGVAGDGGQHQGASRLPAEISDLVAGDYYAALGVAQAVGDIDSQAAGQIAGAAQQAWIDGWVSSMWVGVALSAAAFIYLLVAGPRKTDTADDAADPQPVMMDERALAGASQAG